VSSRWTRLRRRNTTLLGISNDAVRHANVTNAASATVLVSGSITSTASVTIATQATDNISWTYADASHYIDSAISATDTSTVTLTATRKSTPPRSRFSPTTI